MKLAFNFLISRFSTWTKNQDKYCNILRTKKALKGNKKQFSSFLKSFQLPKTWECAFKTKRLLRVKKQVLFLHFIVSFVLSVFDLETKTYNYVLFMFFMLTIWEPGLHCVKSLQIVRQYVIDNSNIFNMASKWYYSGSISS